MISGHIENKDEPKRITDAIQRAIAAETPLTVRASLLDVISISRRNYLSGPRPQRLGVVSGRLRNSLQEQEGPESIFRIEVDVPGPGHVTGTVGTRVIYAGIHTTGGIIRPVRAKFLAIPTPFIKTLAGAIKAQYAGPIRQIPNTFVIRSKGGPLMIWQQLRPKRLKNQPLSAVAIPLFTLVKQVKIPSRPFLEPALQDALPRIGRRVAAMARRAEQTAQGVSS